MCRLHEKNIVQPSSDSSQLLSFEAVLLSFAVLQVIRKAVTSFKYR